MKKHVFTATGIPSVFLIFSVMSMVILCMMTLAVSRTDLHVSQVSLEQAEGYYQACTEGTEMLTQIREALSDPEMVSLSEADFYEEVKVLVSSRFSAVAVWEAEARVLKLTVPYTDKLSLIMEAEVQVPKEGLEPLKLLSWKTAYTGDWSPDTHQDLFVPGELF